MVKSHLLPPDLTPEQISYTYASKADLINVALFGRTAKQRRDANPNEKGNMRDQASLNHLLVLAANIYTRVSTAMQVDGYSLDAQKDKLRKYAVFSP